ncbi:MAG TPA: helix-hairpin-helix domain-containing protein [Candidatus Eisenbacteria bacterium]|nr:helix-hairpin-helix domain-containing protein [Candidatus Eisenbacteria bacterium]
MLYSLPQLRLLILLALALLVGLGVREWRAGFPDAASRLERFDRDESPIPLLGETPPVPTRPAPARVAPPPAAAPEPAPIKPVDVNRAAVAELAALPGVGPGLAQRIVEERERRGRFDSPEALRYVLGMGPKKLAAIRRFVTVSD